VWCVYDSSDENRPEPAAVYHVGTGSQPASPYEAAPVYTEYAGAAAAAAGGGDGLVHFDKSPLFDDTFDMPPDSYNNNTSTGL